MQSINYNRLRAVTLLAGLASGHSAWALSPGDTLTISRASPVNGTSICASIGTTHPYPAGNGSCFGMEVNPGSISNTRLTGFNGLVIGSAQSASGSHTGSPSNTQPPYTTESPGIDRPWVFFSNTGMHFTSSPVNVLVQPSGTAPGILDFSGWNVTWNGIASIYMGVGAHSGYTDSQAEITCNPSNCANGATYTLAYTATVPATSPNFPGVMYSLRLEGLVIVPGGPQSSPVGITAGGTGGAATIRITEADLTNGGIPADSGFSHTGGYYDFVTPATAMGGTTQVVLPLTTALPADFVYRKYKNGSWGSFVTDANNNIKSAPGTGPGGTCPAPGNAAYLSPATAGHYCLQLTIEDGGPNDADGNLDASVRDPGGVATPVAVFTDTRTSGSSGCSLSTTQVNPLDRGDWWLLLGFITWIGFVTRRRHTR